MGKKKLNPYTEFILEMIKKLDTPDLQTISRAVNEKLSGERIIDIPASQHFENEHEHNKSHEKERENRRDTPFEKQNLENMIGQILQALGGANQPHDSTHDHEDQKTPQFFDNQIISSLPKLFQMGNTLGLGAKSREEILFEAVLPFIPEATRTKLESVRPFLKVYQIIQTLR